jgi:hypothetical protein
MDIHNGSFAFLEDIRKQTFCVDTYVNPFFWNLYGNPFVSWYVESVRWDFGTTVNQLFDHTSG